MGSRKPSLPIGRTCPGCNRVFTSVNRNKQCGNCRKQVYLPCCPQCGGKMEPKSATCSKCRPTYSGAANPNWRGGRTKHQRGYVLLWVDSHPRLANKSGYVFQHILTMEATLGRNLHMNERVHHRNGIRDDNRPENLELWTSPHPTGVRVEDSVAHAIDVLQKYRPELLVLPSGFEPPFSP